MEKNAYFLILTQTQINLLEIFYLSLEILELDYFLPLEYFSSKEEIKNFI